ncbi:hypothetical protein [Micromonospora radicis]|nr:hypothetical protein [Micromonospora radicis]
MTPTQPALIMRLAAVAEIGIAVNIMINGVVRGGAGWSGEVG